MKRGPPFFSRAPSQADVFFLKRPPRSFRSRRVFEKKAHPTPGRTVRRCGGGGSQNILFCMVSVVGNLKNSRFEIDINLKSGIFEFSTTRNPIIKCFVEKK